jgi:hypothetical protein
MLRNPDGSMPAGAINRVRGAGRPKGAGNKRSKKIADYYVQRFGDPLEAIGQLANTPLRQLIEVLLEADGSAEREARLLEGVDQAVEHIKSLQRVGGKEMADELADAIDKLASAAARISGKPGKLALDALVLQFQAHRAATEYVHGKQPISVEHVNKTDLVVFAPEILKEHGIDATALQHAIATRGLEAFDAESMRIVPSSEIEDAEFTEAPDESEGE